MNLNKLVTEARNSHTYDIDELSPLELVRRINCEDKKVAYCVEKELKQIALIIEACVNCLKKEGRIIYVGAGTSGRIGLLDAVECPPTFGVDSSKVIAMLAGGYDSTYAKEEAEDNQILGREDAIKLNLNKNDIIIGVAASGRTPYVIGALDYAKECGATTACICCNKRSEISKHVDIAVEVDNGPEVLTGSTRLKAGTSQKMICNMITTSSMILMGKVYQNLMVDVEVSNDKLRARWSNIVSEATHVSKEVADNYYDLSEKSAKVAIIMILLNITKEEALKALNKSHGHVKKVLRKAD